MSPAALHLNTLLEEERVGALPLVRRLLHIDADASCAALIDVQDTNAMPEWHPISTLEAGLAAGTLRVREDDPFCADTRPDRELTEASRRVRDGRYRILGPLVDLVADPGQAILREGERGPLLLAARAAHGTSLGKLYLWLRAYWQRGQTVNALLPGYTRCGTRLDGAPKSVGARKRGRPSKLALMEPTRAGMNVTTEVRGLIAKGGRRYWKKQVAGRRLSLREAHQRTLETFFYARLEYREGVLTPVLRDADELPTFRQFCYWLGKERKAEADLRARYGDREFALKHRAKPGTTEHLSRGPCDLYLIDATVADIYLLSSMDRNRVIGRPVLYLVVDHFSRMIVGFYVGLEGPSWLGAMMALENALTNKVEFCARYGIQIAPEDWPCHYIPRSITGDRGEMLCEDSDHLVTAFGIAVANTPPFRADFKSFVEAQFKITNERGIRRQPGWVDKQRPRGGRDYRLDAALTLEHFTRLMIELVLHNNRARRIRTQVAPDYPLAQDGDPTPLDLWEWGMRNRVGAGRTMDRGRTRVNLLPSEEATATPQGIRLFGLNYDSATGREEGWFLRGTGRASVRVDVAYDPRDVSRVFLRLDRGRKIEECPLTETDAARYAGLTLEEVQDDQDRADIRRQTDRGAEHQSLADLHARLDHITAEGVRERDEALGGPGRDPVVIDISQAKSAERRALRAEQAFTADPATPAPSAASRPPASASADPDDDDAYIPFPD
jgi:hypothetical protein